jgi:hypothetical protein
MLLEITTKDFGITDKAKGISEILCTNSGSATMAYPEMGHLPYQQ